MKRLCGCLCLLLLALLPAACQQAGVTYRSDPAHPGLGTREALQAQMQRTISELRGAQAALRRAADDTGLSADLPDPSTLDANRNARPSPEESRRSNVAFACVDARRAIAELERNAGDWFVAWRREIAAHPDPEVRQTSQAELDAFLGHYHRLHERLQQARSALSSDGPRSREGLESAAATLDDTVSALSEFVAAMR